MDLGMSWMCLPEGLETKGCGGTELIVTLIRRACYIDTGGCRSLGAGRGSLPLFLPCQVNKQTDSANSKGTPSRG